MATPTNWNDMCFYRTDDAGQTWELKSIIPHRLGAFDSYQSVERATYSDFYPAPYAGREAPLYVQGGNGGTYWPIWDPSGALALPNMHGPSVRVWEYSWDSFQMQLSNAAAIDWFGDYPLMSWYRGDSYRAVVLGLAGGLDYSEFSDPNTYVWATTDRGTSWVMLINAANFGTLWQSGLRRYALYQVIEESGTYTYILAQGGDPNSSYWDAAVPYWQPGMPLFAYEKIIPHSFDDPSLTIPYYPHFSTGPGGIIAGPPTLRAGGPGAGRATFGIEVG